MKDTMAYEIIQIYSYPSLKVTTNFKIDATAFLRMAQHKFRLIDAIKVHRGKERGTLTKGEGTVRLTSSLSQIVF
jgi:hypothetical protein